MKHLFAAFVLSFAWAGTACDDRPASAADGAPQGSVTAVQTGEEAAEDEAAAGEELVAQESGEPTSAPSGDEPTSAPSEDEHHAAPEVPMPETTTVREDGVVLEHRGGGFVLESAPITLTEALTSCVGTGMPCKVEATIDQVCQNRGCWFTLQAEGVESEVRVRMQDYAFFLPMDAMGCSVLFEGLLTEETISQEEAQHYADETAVEGAEPVVIEGPVQSYMFMITAAEVRRDAL